MRLWPLLAILLFLGVSFALFTGPGAGDNTTRADVGFDITAIKYGSYVSLYDGIVDSIRRGKQPFLTVPFRESQIIRFWRYPAVFRHSG